MDRTPESIFFVHFTPPPFRQKKGLELFAKEFALGVDVMGREVLPFFFFNLLELRHRRGRRLPL